MEHCVAVRSGDDGHKGMFPAMRGFVGHDGVELTVAQRGFVYAKMRPDVLRKHLPMSGMKPLCCVLPLPIAAKVALVLPLEQISVNAEEPFKRAARNRVSVQAYLLKKPQTLSRSECLRLLNPIDGLRFCPSLHQPIGDA